MLAIKNKYSLTLLVAISACCCALLLTGASAQDLDDGARLEEHYLLRNECQNVLNEQISMELYASIVYMNMGAYFDRPSVARNGYAKFFKAQSQEEYNHAQKFIDYVNSRNGTVKRINIEESPKSVWSSPVEALRDAIKLEKEVYAKLQYIHDVAEQKCQDSHLTDFLEGEYFTEQVESIKELQTMLTKIDVADKSAAAVIVHITDEKLAKKEELWMND